jgi:hypothetical protein
MGERAEESPGDTNCPHRPESDPAGLPIVFADFHNADPLGRVRLNTNGAIERFKTLGIQPFPDLIILLYDGEQFSATGKVLWDDTEGWVAEIDWSRLK